MKQEKIGCGVQHTWQSKQMPLKSSHSDSREKEDKTPEM